MTFSMPVSSSLRARQILCTPTSDQPDTTDTRREKKKKESSTPLSDLPEQVLPRGEQLFSEGTLSSVKHTTSFCSFLLSTLSSFNMFVFLFHLSFQKQRSRDCGGSICSAQYSQQTKPLKATGISRLPVSSFFIPVHDNNKMATLVVWFHHYCPDFPD